MAILTFNGESYTVDHAVKGADYIHGYDAAGVILVSFEGIIDFSGFSYDGMYMEAGHCLAEGCNDVKHMDGGLKKADGTALSPADYGAAEKGHTHTHTDVGAAPAYTYGTTDLTAGSSALTTGTLHFVYE